MLKGFLSSKYKESTVNLSSFEVSTENNAALCSFLGRLLIQQPLEISFHRKFKANVFVWFLSESSGPRGEPYF